MSPTRADPLVATKPVTPKKKGTQLSKNEKGRRPVGATVGSQTQAKGRRPGKMTPPKTPPLTGPNYPGYAPN